MNKETLDAMKKGADVLKGIHGKLWVHQQACVAIVSGYG
jgi:hypothetical protein